MANSRGMVIAGAVLISVVLFSGYFITTNFVSRNYVEVTNVRLSESYGMVWVIFTVKNVGSVNLNYVSIRIDDRNLGTFIGVLPPGKTAKNPIPLGDLNLPCGQMYDVELTFTMADGRNMTYLTNCTIP
jgi:hypothetical protein